METGVDSGARNIGRFFLMAIPAVLGIAASLWLGVYIGVHNFKHELSQEERAAQYVGAQERPTSKLAFELLNRSCVRITKADVDGTTLLVYAKNYCHRDVDYVAIHWQAFSPDNTIVQGGYDNGVECEMPKIADTTSECRFQYVSDDRAAGVTLWTQITP